MRDASRRDLEEIWRQRVEAAQENYRLALEEWRKVKAEYKARRRSSLGGASLPEALRRQIRARAAYVRVLRTFALLVLHGEIPKVEGPN
jgi:hypothetical protein